MTYCSVIKKEKKKKVICLANLKLFLVRYKLGAFSYRCIYSILHTVLCDMDKNESCCLGQILFWFYNRTFLSGRHSNLIIIGILGGSGNAKFMC